ncbi:MAG: septum formation protein Maf [Bacteroidales bacterium]|nr:septum formation protein Maf [Bacteroidales bacterium]MBQ4012870.1 septum formation protein Maf [Bacteroidales bacterium]
MFENYTFTLASASPRRRELLKGLDIAFSVEPGKDEREAYSAGMPHTEIPAFLARHKSETFHRELRPDEVLITADTLVFLDEKVLGKPRDAEDAAAMLRALSGRTHAVITGMALRTCGKTHTFSDTTEVDFKTLSEHEIRYYIEQYRPFDKAGAYGIQEWIGYVGITAIRGSYFNVMGLPVQKLYTELCDFLC